MNPKEYLKKVHDLIPQIVALTREEDLWVLWDKIPTLKTDPNEKHSYYYHNSCDPLELKKVNIKNTSKKDYELHTIKMEKVKEKY